MHMSVIAQQSWILSSAPLSLPSINSIVTPLFQQFGYLFNAGAKVSDLKIKISKDLNLTKEEVQEQIATDTAASDEVVPTKRVKEWMKEVQAMEEVMENIDEDYNHRKICLAGCPINCWSSYRIGKRAAKAALEAKDLIRERESFDVLTKRAAPAIRRILSLPEATTASTELYTREASSCLQDEEVGMIGIWGMGGVGKTTLLKRINNHPSVEAAGFDYVIWVVSSHDCNLDKLQKDIAERILLTFKDTATLESQAQALYRYLEMKSFLLLLDDIWEPVDLGQIGIPCPISSDGAIPKRKVVFTTRSETVCDQMPAYQKFPVRCKKIKVECLQREEAWQVFLSTIGESMRSIISSDSRVCNRAEKVASKCGGLPLALVVIAKAMSGNKTWQEWEAAINLLNKIGIQEMWSKRADHFPLLKVSYDHLPNEIVKNCFLSCALWPEDHNIFESGLIISWLSMNLIGDYDNFAEGYTRGRAIVQCLRRACLLEEGDESYAANVKMHDIIRGTALWIISVCKKKWMVINQAKLKHGSEDATECREAEAISLMFRRAGTLPQHLDCPNILFLFLQRNSISMIPEDFFWNMSALTYLDLSYNPISELPPAIGCLATLKYLNLVSTSICSLPMELGNLAELKELFLTNTESLRSIPQGLLSRLQKLDVLTMCNSAFVGWDMEGQASIDELVCSKITSLSLDLMSLQIVEQLFKNPFMSLWWLAIRDLEATTTLPLQSLLQIGNTRCTLIELVIWDCYSLEEIIISSGCLEEFDSLERFGLYNVPGLKKITSAGAMRGSLLRNIRFLSIGRCPELKNATWILQFPFLESLSIEDCDRMENVIGDEEGGDGGSDEVSLERNEHQPLTVFSNLMHLRLVGLPELRSFSTSVADFPSLKYLSIVECPKLDEAPFSHLKIRRKYEYRLMI